MTEPRLEPGDTWEAFRNRLLLRLFELEIQEVTCEPWEALAVRVALDQTRFALSCAERELGFETPEVTW